MRPQDFTKWRENPRPALAAVRMLRCSKDPIVIPASKETAYSKVQLNGWLSLSDSDSTGLMLAQRGGYESLDIVKTGIDWYTNRITRRYQ